MTGTLYIVGTPIGNLNDLTFRATQILSSVTVVAAEDTRRTRQLLTHLNTRARLISYNDHSSLKKTSQLVEILKTTNVALVTDAGMPAVSDPGAMLVRQAFEAGIAVVPIPGPSAVTTALSVAGIPTHGFRFVGFLPRKKTERQHHIQQLSKDALPLVIFEAPHRMKMTMQELALVLGNRNVVICRELTKIHEEIFKGTIIEASSYFTSPRGEFVIVVEGVPRMEEAETRPVQEVGVLLGRLKQAGLRRKDAVSVVTNIYDISAKEAYRVWLKA